MVFKVSGTANLLMNMLALLITGFPQFSWLPKISGIQKHFFQDSVVSQQCFNIATNSSRGVWGALAAP